VTTIENRIQQLVKAPDLPSRSYQTISANFEKMAKKYSWTNKDGSVYPVSLGNLQRYIAYSETRVKPQSILSYLAAIKDKHEQLGFLEWGNVRYDATIGRMLRSIKRNFLHQGTRRARPISSEHLKTLKGRLNLRKPRHALFWAVAVVAFHAMARLGELLPATNSRIEFSIRLKHLTLEKGPKRPYALIMLPTTKVHDPNVETSLAIWADKSEICPWEALRTFLKFRLQKHYGTESDALWCIENGHAIIKTWFLEALATYLPEFSFTGHSFRSGGATYWASLGLPKWIIQRLGRWSSDAFEGYIRTNASILVGFAQALTGPSRQSAKGSLEVLSLSGGEPAFGVDNAVPRDISRTCYGSNNKA